MINTIQLENYRCFEKTKIKVKQISIFVGKNNAGKSSLIEALRMVAMAIRKSTSVIYKELPLEFGLGHRIKGFKLDVDKLKIDLWGSGIRRILNAAVEYKLPVPKVEAFDDMFRVNLYRNAQDNGNNRSFGENFGDNFGENGVENFGEKVAIRKDKQKVTDTQRKILGCIADDKYISAKQIAEKIGVSGRTVENNIKKLKDADILVRHGSPKSGYWEMME